MEKNVGLSVGQAKLLVFGGDVVMQGSAVIQNIKAGIVLDNDDESSVICLYAFDRLRHRTFCLHRVFGTTQTNPVAADINACAPEKIPATNETNYRANTLDPAVV